MASRCRLVLGVCVDARNGLDVESVAVRPSSGPVNGATFFRLPAAD